MTRNKALASIAAVGDEIEVEGVTFRIASRSLDEDEIYFTAFTLNESTNKLIETWVSYTDKISQLEKGLILNYQKNEKNIK